MREMIEEVSGQSFKEYIWPDVETSLGKQTGLFEGGLMSFVLALVYIVKALQLHFYGATIPPELEVLSKTLAGLEGLQLPLDIRKLLNPEVYASGIMLSYTICIASALFYVRSIGRNESRVSAIFLIAWALIEAVSEYRDGSIMMVAVFAAVLVGGVNSFRSMNS